MTYRSGDYSQKVYPPDIDKYIADYDTYGNQLTAMQDAIGTASPYVYDDAGRLTSMTDSNGNTIGYA